MYNPKYLGLFFPKKVFKLLVTLFQGNAWSDYTASEVFKHEEKYKPPQNCLSLTPGKKTFI